MTLKLERSSGSSVERLHGSLAPATLQLELVSVKARNSYTSLRDIIVPSSPITSPSPSVAIRNHLVKQAAWAYLQPLSASPSSAGPRFFRFSDHASDSSCLAFFVASLDRLLSLFQLPSHTR